MGHPRNLTEIVSGCEVRKNRKKPSPNNKQWVLTGRRCYGAKKSFPRELYARNIHWCFALNKPNINPSNKTARLCWCLQRRIWTVDHWKTVSCSDESCYVRFQSDGHTWVWQVPGKHKLLECIVLILKFGVGYILLWRSFTGYGLRHWHVIPSKLNPNQYEAKNSKIYILEF